MDISEKFCPVCKNKNERNAVVCVHCGASMEGISTNMVRTTSDTGGPSIDLSKIPDSFIDRSLIPEDGIAIYAAGTLKPYYLRITDEIIIGRKGNDNLENLLDLSELDGYNMGISRRHLRIRNVENGYEITDLASTNGTWMNEERLVPNKPYVLKNGSQVRLGRLKLLVTYLTESETASKN